MEKNNNAYWVGKEILKSGMTMGEPAKTDPEQTALFQLDTKKEALRLAVAALKNTRDRSPWQSRYFNRPDQIKAIETAFNDIINDLEYQSFEMNSL